MYRIYNNDALLYDPVTPGLGLEKAVLRQEANRHDTLTFTIYPRHRGFSGVSRAESALTVARGDVIVSRLRPVAARADLKGGVTYRCEGLTACLNDVAMRPFEFSGTAAEFLDLALGQYAEMAAPDGDVSLLGRRTLRKGCTGGDVRQLQAALVRLGFSVGRWGCDGIFGSATRSGLEAFQRACGLSADGVLDRQTLDRLLDRLAEADVTEGDLIGRAVRPRFRAGRVSGADEPLEVSDAGYPGCWDALKAHLAEGRGAYLVPRYEDGAIIIDCLREEDLPLGRQTVRAGRNLAGLVLENDASDTFTAVLPLGRRLSGGGRLTVASVNGGSDVIVSETGRALYGHREKVMIWDEAEDAAALMALGQAALEARGAGLWERIDARALDLSRTDPEQEGLFWMTRHRVVAEAQGVDDVYLLKSVTVPLGDPTASVIGLGAERLSLYDRLARSAP